MSSTRDDILATIAREALDFETLETQRSGRDFREVAVWSVREALERAFEAGRRSAREK